jgi:hypothetical protein
MKKVDYKSTGKKHENKVPWTSLVATEVANIIGDVEEWRAAFKTFCKKKENVLGKKVDRSQLLKYSYRNFQC